MTNRYVQQESEEQMLNDLPDMSHLPEQDQQAIQDFVAYPREKAADQRKFCIGQRVRILIPVSHCATQEGVIYDYLPSRLWPWRVRPDGEFWEGEGIAFTEDELEPIEDRKEIDERIAALDARLINYDEVAAGAIADLEASWHEKQEETK